MRKIDISNSERLRILGEALYSKNNRGWWKIPLARELGIRKWNVQRWMRDEPNDEVICRVMAIAKFHLAQLQAAIDKATLYPWIK